MISTIGRKIFFNRSLSRHLRTSQLNYDWKRWNIHHYITFGKCQQLNKQYLSRCFRASQMNLTTGYYDHLRRNYVRDIQSALDSIQLSHGNEDKVAHQVSDTEMIDHNVSAAEGLTAHESKMQMLASPKSDGDGLFEQKRELLLLLEENRKLVSKLQELTGINQYQLIQIENQLIENKIEINILREENERLKKKIIEMEYEIKCLKSDLEVVKSTARIDKEALDAKIQITEEKLAVVNSRDSPITVREAMRILERNICIKATGSKRQYTKYFNFELIKTSKNNLLINNFYAELKRVGLSEDHIEMIRFLKEIGNEAAHNQRPMLTVKEWELLIVSFNSKNERR